MIYLVSDDLALQNDLLRELIVKRKQHNVLELEKQKKIAASVTIQHWHRRITSRQLELEQQFQVQQQLDLEALEE